MKVRFCIEVGDRDRYVIAKHYRSGRARATRAQVRRFVVGALTWALREQADALPRRSRAKAASLPEAPAREAMRPPAERQMDLLAGVVGEMDMQAKGRNR